MKYTIEIIETLRYEEEVEANNIDEAINIIKQKYKNEEIILTPEHLEEVIIQEK